MSIQKRRAVCIHCGNLKPHFLSECRKCGFIPLSLSAKARSLILSMDYERQSNEYGNEPSEVSLRDLEDMGRRIESGIDFEYDDEAILDAERHLQSIEALTAKDVFRATFLWLLPVIVVFVVTVVYLFLK